MKTLLAFAALAVFQLATAQKTTQVKSFEKFAVSGGIDVTLVKSSDNKVVVESGDESKLEINSQEGSLGLKARDKSASLTVTVYYTNGIEGIACSGGSEIKTKNSLKTPTLSIAAASGSEITIDADVSGEVSVAAASGSEVTVSGSAKIHNAAVASGAELHADKLKAGDAAITVASGGEAAVYSSGIVDATVASGGELNIYGNPKKVNEIKANGAEINVVK